MKTLIYKSVEPSLTVGLLPRWPLFSPFYCEHENLLNKIFKSRLE